MQRIKVDQSQWQVILENPTKLRVA